MKCPFKKETYTRSSNVMHGGYPADKETFEVFTDCIGEECAMWSGKDCSFKQERFNYSLEELSNFLFPKEPWDNQENWRLP